MPIDARTEEITYLLKAWGSGDEGALVRLTEHVYPELRLMARRYMKNEAQGNSLQATVLVHEVISAWSTWPTSNGRRARSSLPSRPR